MTNLYIYSYQWSQLRNQLLNHDDCWWFCSVKRKFSEKNKHMEITEGSCSAVPHVNRSFLFGYAVALLIGCVTVVVSLSALYGSLYWYHIQTKNYPTEKYSDNIFFWRQGYTQRFDKHNWRRFNKLYSS